MKPNPFAPAGKFTSTDSCEWFEGGFAVVCQSEGKGPMGTTKGLGIMSYSVEEKATRTPLPAADVASAIRPTRCSNPPWSADGPQAAGAHSR